VIIVEHAREQFFSNIMARMSFTLPQKTCHLNHFNPSTDDLEKVKCIIAIINIT
jgi:hypothetical protein